MSYRKWCVVPQCTNTTSKTPNKLFLSVPKNSKRRKMWLQLARRDPNSIESNTSVFMCEDHFDVEKVVKNYMQHKMGFCKRLLLANDAVPTMFFCQEERNQQPLQTEFSPQALKRMNLDAECLQSQNPTKTETQILLDNEMLERETDPYPVAIITVHKSRESSKIDDNMLPKVFEPEVLLKTQEKIFIPDIITEENSVQVKSKDNKSIIGARLCKYNERE